MRQERSLWAVFLIPTLVPPLGAGVSPVELLALVLSLIAGARLMLNYSRATRLPSATWLMVSYLVLSLVGLTHDSIGVFASHFAGGLVFTIAAVVGGCAPARLSWSIVKWLFLLLLVGATLDITLDLAGWSPVAEKERTAWEIGARGLRAAQSLNGAYLAPFVAFMLIAAPSMKWRVLGLGSLLLVFYHVVVFGQGRGATTLAVLGMVVVFARERISVPAALLVLGPFIAVVVSGFFDEATAPFIERVTSEELSEVDRLRHAEVGERLVRNMSRDELFVGINYKKVLIANGGAGMHNALFDVLTRFGLFVALPWIAFNVASLVAAGVTLLRRDIELKQTVAATVVIQMIAALTAAPLFVNWRSCLVPGICAGLALQVFQSRDRRWDRS